MDPAPGKSFGHFTFVEKLGEGGMGVVWKAMDTRLGREVAVKILPGSLANDPERMERFNREARVLASLNHPNIAGIHGLEEHEGSRFLVMELVPGQDLMHRLVAGPVAPDEALEAARQIADGLEAAHESGVIHRDLKPANIQITPEGQIKILDFGLAKAFEPELDSPTGSLSPTLTTPATRAGVILGTAAYMSPEQAKGKKVDKRADIWAFGCVLFEMLTGLRPFKGEGISETLASVIMGAPDLERLPEGTPPAVRRLLERCLEKDPKRRLRDVGEARFVLEETLAGRGATAGDAEASGETGSPRRTGASMTPLVAIAVVAAAVGGIASWLLRPAPPERPLRRFEIPVRGVTDSPSNGTTLAISPDGRTLAYVSENKLYLRPLDSLEAREVPAAGAPYYIFWSPDSHWLGFTTAGKIWKVAVEGVSEPAIVTEEPSPPAGGAGGTWTPDGRIVFSRGVDNLYQVPARGGDISTLLEVVPDKDDDFHQPYALPDGSILFVTHVHSGRPDTLEILSGGKREVLYRAEGQTLRGTVYSPTGHILFRRQPVNAGIWALPFDAASQRVTGDAFLAVPEGNLPTVSADGTLAHVFGSSSRQSQIVVQGRDGELISRIEEPTSWWPYPTLSPDGDLIACSTAGGEENEVWIQDLARGTRTRLTFGSLGPGEPFFSADGQMVYYQEGTIAAPFTMYRKRVDGSGEPEKLGMGWRPVTSSDGRYLLFTEENGDASYDVWLRDLEEGGDDRILVTGPNIQANPRVSPDGSYFLYNSLETGGAWGDVFLKRFPSGEGKWQVSIDHGSWPRWSADGRKIYYSNDDVIWEVEFSGSPAVKLGKPRVAFPEVKVGYSIANGWEPGYDVSRDGRTAIRVQGLEQDTGLGYIVVVEGWRAGSGTGK